MDDLSVGEDNVPAIYRKSNTGKGYYVSYVDVPFDDNQKEPKLVVRKKVNLVPMCVKDVSLRNPGSLASDKRPKFPDEMNFDLEAGEFCSPHGRGKVADLKFKVDRTSPEEPVVRLFFSNKFDGILPIMLDGETTVRNDAYGPFQAPSDGYLKSKEWVCESKHKTDIIKSSKQNVPYVDMYIFRVRSVEDKDGNLKTACCGKIVSDFRFSVSDIGFEDIVFRYHYNPDGTRNLECDLEKNLLKRHPIRGEKNRIGVF